MPPKKLRRKKSKRADEGSEGEESNWNEPLVTILCCIKVKKGTSVS
jgi:hypothetical protein